MVTPDNRMLSEVTIDGTPNITYKTDTIEYRAAGYQVREHATVDELLKKMEGMQVSRDGTLTHQGEKITTARLNGRDFLGGNVATSLNTNIPSSLALVEIESVVSSASVSYFKIKVAPGTGFRVESNTIPLTSHDFIGGTELSA